MRDKIKYGYITSCRMVSKKFVGNCLSLGFLRTGHPIQESKILLLKGLLHPKNLLNLNHSS